jgi:hypothetical protein
MLELTRRYVVMAMATEAPFDPRHPDEPFVLKPWKDPAALRALHTYAQSCYPELRAELETWMREIEAGPVVRGDVGRRNEPYSAAAPPPRTRRRRAKTRSSAAPRHAKPRRGAAKPKKRRR